MQEHSHARLPRRAAAHAPAQRPADLLRVGAAEALGGALPRNHALELPEHCVHMRALRELCQERPVAVVRNLLARLQLKQGIAFHQLAAS